MTQQGDKPTGLRRHLEGWQLGLVCVCMALLAALLAMPRASEPDVFPAPKLDTRKLDHIVRDSTTRTERVLTSPLSFVVRAAGEAFRAYGKASRQDGSDQFEAEEELTQRVAEALAASGAEPLLDLMAVQTQLFLAALRRWEASGVSDAELLELGGNFPDKAKASGWIGANHRLLLSTHERVILFRVRWTTLAGLRGRHPFAPTLEEWRAYYAFLLRHPESSRLALPQQVAQKRLSYVNALSRLDSDYPVEFARGIALYQAGDYPQASRALQAHLVRHPKGPWTLRARNFWLSAARLSKGTTE